jgi:hypothetical protein
MRSRYVVDTNVLIAANTGNPAETRKLDVTPPDEGLQRTVWHWLVSLQKSSARIVVDIQGKIRKEYDPYILPGGYAEQFMIAMSSSCRVDPVSLIYDENGYAVIAEPLHIVHDLSDRKMVAACVEAMAFYGECVIAFAGDTDWHYWEETLNANGIDLEPIIESWSRPAYDKKKRSG